MTIELPRRSFLVGLGSLIAAPAIVRASSLMPVSAYPQGILIRSNSLLLIEQITRDAVRLFTNSNKFIEEIDSRYDEIFGVTSIQFPSNMRIGIQLTIINNSDKPIQLLGVNTNDLHS